MRLKSILSTFILSTLPFLTTAQELEVGAASARKWYAPDAVTVQFAGNIGMFAIAPSYSFAKDKLNAELFYGYVPKLDADEALHILTLKGVYKPIRNARIREGISLTPLRLGLGLSYYFRSQFSTNWSNAYPTSDYYWWTSSLRLTGSLGPAINFSLPNNQHFRELSLYGDVNTYDLIVTSAVRDESLTAWDIISFSAGLRASFR
ncbi:hypothetical protein [Pontibacter oryzae]|uniref:Outer membrane protein beta-barrel domain-containing protein n=1 Tax=Pontibacter oryzae TaxID=2304593 RepID=A0A399RX84_9BACT|nr:hypothetical protein [Pontibacter oryzae]RIJ34432.1 hypothetical protein D1627_16090 [Pontibacter oryzae]